MAEQLDAQAQRNALTVDAAAELSDLSRAVRRLIGQNSADYQGAAIKAIMVRIEALSDALVFMADPGWDKSIEDAAAIVNACDCESGS
jgi:hypothetical protein